jgi:hypothetical protein
MAAGAHDPVTRQQTSDASERMPHHSSGAQTLGGNHDPWNDDFARNEYAWI